MNNSSPAQLWISRIPQCMRIPNQMKVTLCSWNNPHGSSNALIWPPVLGGKLTTVVRVCGELLVEHVMQATTSKEAHDQSDRCCICYFLFLPVNKIPSHLSQCWVQFQCFYLRLFNQAHAMNVVNLNRIRSS